MALLVFTIRSRETPKGDPRRTKSLLGWKTKHTNMTTIANRNIIGSLLPFSIQHDKPIDMKKRLTLSSFTSSIKLSNRRWEAPCDFKMQNDSVIASWVPKRRHRISFKRRIVHECGRHGIYHWCHCSNKDNDKTPKVIWRVCLEVSWSASKRLQTRQTRSRHIQGSVDQKCRKRISWNRL